MCDGRCLAVDAWLDHQCLALLLRVVITLHWITTLHHRIAPRISKNWILHLATHGMHVIVARKFMIPPELCGAGHVNTRKSRVQSENYTPRMGSRQMKCRPKRWACDVSWRRIIKAIANKTNVIQENASMTFIS